MNIGTRYTKQHVLRRAGDYEELNTPISGADYSVQTALIGKPVEERKLRLIKHDHLAYFAACVLAVGAFALSVS